MTNDALTITKLLLFLSLFVAVFCGGGGLLINGTEDQISVWIIIVAFSLSALLSFVVWFHYMVETLAKQKRRLETRK